MIQMDLSHIRQFIPLPYEEARAAQLRLAHSHLQHGDGAGGEFTGWVQLPRQYDREEFARIQAAARKIQQDSQALVVIGIGGSYLGARGVIECLCSPNYNLKKKDTPNIYFTGNGLSSDQMAELMDLLEGVDFSVNVISKSGTTTEPAVAFRFFRKLLEERYGPEEAARRIGKSQSAVANKLRLLKLPPEALYLLRESGLTERHARALLRLEGNEARLSALRHVAANHLTVAKTEAYVESLLSPKPQKRKPTYLIKDVRFFLNTVTRGLSLMKGAGIDAQCGRQETADAILLTIRIPKCS